MGGVAFCGCFAELAKVTALLVFRNVGLTSRMKRETRAFELVHWKQVIRSVVGLLMPIFLIAGGGAMTGWGLDNEWSYVAWAGIGLVVAGIIWGLVVWLLVDLKSW